MSCEYDLDELGEDDGDQFAGPSDDELAAALDWRDERDPLAEYCTPVTRRHKPNAIGRPVVDLPPL